MAFIPPTPAGLHRPSRTVSRPADSSTPLALAPGLAVAFPRPTRRSAPAPTPARSPASAPALGHPRPAPAAPASARAVVWFRGDLRLHDHPALAHAVEEGGGAVCVYVFDPRAFGKTAFGFEKTGRYRAKFLVEAVAELRERMRKRGGELVVRVGKPEEVVVEVARRAGAREVFFHREVSYEEQTVEEAVAEACGKARLDVKRFWANTLYHSEDLPFELRNMPDVYTEFREAVQREGVIRAPLAAPEELSALPAALDAGAVPTLKELGLSEPDAAAHGLHAFVGGEGEALRRLRAYIEETRGVPQGRTTAVHLGADFSCKISPWLALGCVSPRRIHADLTEHAAKAGKTSTYFELIWRDFFRFITMKYAQNRIAEGEARSGAAGSSGRNRHAARGASVGAAARNQASSARSLMPAMR